jgi:hypothetical protein
MLDDPALLDRARELGYERGGDGGPSAWYRGGTQVSPHFDSEAELMGWLRRELNEDE